MTKTKLIGGVVVVLIGFIIGLLLATPAKSHPGANAKSVPTATDRVVYRSAEHRFAESEEAGIEEGYMPSLYRGEWFSAQWESARKCIMHRESRFNYRAANKSSSARGAYQFLDSQWRDGLVWMMLEESKNEKDGLAVSIKELKNKPIHHWSRYYQDRAFYTAWQHGKGKKHWAYQGSRCF
jgi:muramidase (phage lysozyme)